MDRFEIARYYKTMDALTFIRYLLSLDAVRAKDEFVRYLKYLINRIRSFSLYGKVSAAKGLNPLNKDKGVNPGYYDYEKTEDYKVQIESFLDMGLGIHELYMKPEYQDIYKELDEYFSLRGKDIYGTELTKDGFFKIPGLKHLITVIPYDAYVEMKDYAKKDPDLKQIDMKRAVMGKTASGKMILNMDHEVVKRFVLSRTLDAKEPDTEKKMRETAEKTEEKTAVPEIKAEKTEEKEEPEAHGVESTGGRWEKCDVSKDADLKNRLSSCPKEEWGGIKVRFTVHGSLITGQDEEHYYVRCPGVMNKGKTWVKVDTLAGKNLIVKIPKKDTKEYKNGIISCTAGIGERYEACDENGAVRTKDGKPVTVYGLVVADKFEIKEINVRPARPEPEKEHTEVKTEEPEGRTSAAEEPPHKVPEKRTEEEEEIEPERFPEADTKEKAVACYEEKIEDLKSYKAGLYQMLEQNISQKDRDDIKSEIFNVEEGIAECRNVIKALTVSRETSMDPDVRQEIADRRTAETPRKGNTVEKKPARPKEGMDI